MIRQRQRINTAVALSAVTAAILIAGCGGSSSSDKAAGVKTVRAAYVSSSAPGYQIAIKVTGNAAGHTINLTGTGAFEPATHAYRLTMNLKSPANIQVTAVILGKDVYVKLPASLAGEIPGGKPWLQLDLSELGKRVGIQGLSSLIDNSGGNPADLLRFLRADSTGSVQNLGHQTVNGIDAARLRATIDLSKVAGTMPSSQRAGASSAITAIEKLTGLRYLPVEAWVDSSDHVRRIVLFEIGRVGAKAFSERVQLDFVKYGLEPVPAAPPADEVTNLMSL